MTDILYSQKFMRLNFLWVYSKSDINPFLQGFLLFTKPMITIYCVNYIWQVNFSDLLL